MNQETKELVNALAAFTSIESELLAYVDADLGNIVQQLCEDARVAICRAEGKPLSSLRVP